MSAVTLMSLAYVSNYVNPKEQLLLERGSKDPFLKFVG